MSAIRPALLKPLLNLVAKPTCRIKEPPLSILPTLSLRPATQLLPCYQHRPFMTTPIKHVNGKSAHEKTVVAAERVAHFERDVWSIFTPLAAETGAINLGQGFMNFLPPEFVLEAVRESVSRNECNQYSHIRGRPRLRKALADSYSPLFGRQLDTETEILVTAGANEGMFAVFASYLNEGDEVICMEPFFDQYIPNITMNGGVPVYVPLHPPANSKTECVSASEWRLDMDELRSKITRRTRIIVVNTPHNPIGKVFEEEELLAIGRLAEEFNLLILSDEVYDRLYFSPREHKRIATLENFWSRTLTVGSGGKSFGITGWRVGWLIGPDHLIKHPLAAQSRIVFCVNSPCQEAVSIAFEYTLKHSTYFSEQIANYERRRSILTSVFDELGLPYTVPDGSYFVLVNTAKLRVPAGYPFPAILDNRARDFKTCYWMTKEIGVCTIPPSEFYSPANRVLAEDFARFAFCKTDEVLFQAVEKLRGLKKYMD
ncbi:pyridoxal phosphate-dependent transferase [Endogone sp. FLAS-F59071]|nr:pyridoxal phosphate-dependent transferase [Endogone sp. FLAS-F59071]|eukprot:RUS22651.1 pyridoxal phosphate-dependent transferase [Endogone sp. FLAS-F59071]